MPKPNIIVLATGHSGSSVVSEMICRLGWNILDSKSRFRAEYKPMRNLNQRVLDGGKVSQQELLDLLYRIPEPWVLKDPRFAKTLDYWYDGWDEFNRESAGGLFLVWLHRDFTKTEQSYLRRREYRVIDGKKQAFEKVSRITLEEAYENCPKLFNAWPWAKLRIDYDELKHAVETFDVARDSGQHQKSGRGGF